MPLPFIVGWFDVLPVLERNLRLGCHETPTLLTELFLRMITDY